ncbi:MAG: TRAP transporter small permease subunit, partial [Pseudomonadota bacterium]
GVSIPALQDALTWSVAACALLGAGWAFDRDGHIRIDALLRRTSDQTRRAVDALGVCVFLTPALVALATVAWPYVRRSWAVAEASPTADGLPGLFLLKTLLLVFCATLAVGGFRRLRAWAAARRR